MNFLPGWFPGALMAGRASILFVASTTDTNLNATITAPASIQAGDILLHFQSCTNDGAVPVAVTPSGFTIIGNTAGVSYRSISSYKIAAGTESGSTITGMPSSSGFTSKIILQFRRSPVAVSISSQDFAGQSIAGTPTGQTLDSGSGVAPLISIGWFGLDSTTRNFSPSGDASVTGGQGQVFYKIYNSAPANHSLSCADGGAENLMSSFYLQVT